MCGLTGYWTGREEPPAAMNATLERMATAIAHRGPDDSGAWTDAAIGLGLAHRRLSIVDLSPEGHQPMRSADGRWVIVFNGEIYNFQALRHELQDAGAAPAWRGHSDTEVLLAAIARWGVTAALQRSVGMFALALWDRHERTLYLARDRLGEKPLYYGLSGGALLFGSELKAMRAHPAWTADIDRDALAEFIQYSCIFQPRSIYQGIGKLPPGTVLAIHADDIQRGRMPAPQPYWSFVDMVSRARAQPLKVSDVEATDLVEAQLRATIADQMVADVPLGAFLSGGIDSSTVVALMQAQSTRKVRTFAIGFAEAQYNEADHAAAVARHLGTAHTEHYATPEELLAVVPMMASMYDEPFADSSQIPTYLVSRLARQHVTASLSGDGGDELFGGYNRYLWAQSLEQRILRRPGWSRRMLGGALQSVSPGTWDAIFKTLRSVLPTKLRVSMPGDKVHKYADLMMMANEAELYQRLVSQWYGGDVVIGARASILNPPVAAALDNVIERMMARDTLAYLPDDILAKVDRAGMAVSLESRIPFLDHRLIELVWRLPVTQKLHGGVTKRVLRKVLYRHVPQALVERPKMGFGVPLDHWLRGPLRGWAEALLDPARMLRQGYLNPVPIQQAWTEHLSGARNWQYRIWNVLMFQAWLDQQHSP